MKLLNSAEVLLMAQTQSGTSYRFREYEKGKWEMLRDGDGHASAELPNDKWVKLAMLPVVEQGQPIVMMLQSGKRVTTTPVTFVGRNN